MVDTQYKVLINGQDFSDIIALDDGYYWTINSYSAESTTGQDTNGKFHIRVLGERVQLVYTMPPYITKGRFQDLVIALEMGSKGQREITVNYDDPLFGVISHTFYCVNVPWLKEKLPDLKDYVKDVQIQLASTRFMGRQVVTDTPAIPPIFNTDPNYEFKINGNEFNDVIGMSGFSGQMIDQSLESKTGLTLDGKFHIPVIGSRTQIETECIEYLEIGRFRQLGKALGFGKTGERFHDLTYVDEIMGKTTQRFYCTEISGYREKTPNFPYHYMRNVRFQQAMKQFF